MLGFRVVVVGTASEAHSRKSLHVKNLYNPSMYKLFRYSRALALIFVLCLSLAHAQTSTENISIDVNAPSHPFPHFWEEMFGSGRAILSLRANYREDLREVKEITDFQYVRFHAILDDEVGVYSEAANGTPIYNFSYVDQIYDGLLASGVKPFVELSFMPYQLAASPTLQAFWYKPNVAPPKDWKKWDDLITALVSHLVSRYGIDEVANWYFEVWNEPNLDFWAGTPKQSTYWELYDHTARDIKKVNSRLRVGGPATAQAAWVGDLIRHCTENHVPLDFVSTHVYGNDSAKDVFGTNETIPRATMVCRAVKKVHEEIEHSATPKIPLIWSEFNASYKNEPDVTDSTYMGPWLANTIGQCDGLVDMMSYWTFSDVFEEQGVVKTPFYGGFGLIAEDDIPKPAFNAFAVLHKLGDQRIDVNSDSALLTRARDGTYSLALWNYSPPDDGGHPENATLNFKGANLVSATIWRVDSDHGDSRDAFRKMGEPPYPTRDQIKQLQAAGELPPPDITDIKNGQLTIEIPPHGLVVAELK
jgi:xylan 1,4-beta-xylosidase